MQFNDSAIQQNGYWKVNTKSMIAVHEKLFIQSCRLVRVLELLNSTDTGYLVMGKGRMNV